MVAMRLGRHRETAVLNIILCQWALTAMHVVPPPEELQGGWNKSTVWILCRPFDGIYNHLFVMWCYVMLFVQGNITFLHFYVPTCAKADIGGRKTKRPKQLEVPEMMGRKQKVTRRWIGHDMRQDGRREVRKRLGRNGARRKSGFWLKGYFLSQGSGCQSDSVAFVVPPFHCDLTLSQGESRHTQHWLVFSITPDTISRSLSVS